MLGSEILLHNMYNSNKRRLKQRLPESIPPRTVWKPQLRVHHLLAGVCEPGGPHRLGARRFSALVNLDLIDVFL